MGVGGQLPLPGAGDGDGEDERDGEGEEGGEGHLVRAVCRGREERVWSRLV